MKNNMVPLLLGYVSSNRLLHQLLPSHSNEELNDLMQSINGREAEILNLFGLPATFDNQRKLQMLSLQEGFDVRDVNEMIRVLEEEAVDWLTRPVMTDLDLLRMAQENELFVGNVLPLTSFKVAVTHYYVYIYQLLLLTTASPEGILEEIRIIEENKLSCHIDAAARADNWRAKAKKLVLSYRLQYLEDYLSYIEAFGYESIHPGIESIHMVTSPPLS